jgi:hypothetical protein
MRNDLDALIVNTEIKDFMIGRKSIRMGNKIHTRSIRDRIIEWEVIDSAGFL